MGLLRWWFNKLRPKLYRARDTERTCEVCERRGAILKRHGMWICEICDDLLP